MPKTDPAIDVSVIVPTLDRAGMLRDTLAGLTQQSHPADRYEVLVVDDGSSDETASVVEACALSAEVKVHYLYQERAGLNAGRNRGVQSAKGELVAFLDDDVEVPPGWLSSVVAGARSYPDVECFAGRIVLRLEGKPPRSCGQHPLGETELELGPESRSADHAWGANMIMRRATFERVGPFDPKLNYNGDEIEWQHRLRSAGGSILYLPDASVVHRRTSRDLRLRRMIKGRFRKGKAWPRLAPLLDRPMSVSGGLRHLVVGLGHAVALRCWGGVLQAAFGLGHAVGAASLLLQRKGDRLTWLPARWKDGEA